MLLDPEVIADAPWTELRTLKQKATDPAVWKRLKESPEAAMELAGHPPDQWQTDALRAPGNLLLLAHRQAGKSETAAAKAICRAIVARSLVLLVSPSLRQSQELFRKVQDHWTAIGRPMSVTRESALRLELRNGSRIISLPGAEGTIRGYSGVDLLVIDEAARVTDELYHAVTPMIAVSQGQIMALTTPWGKRGWFYHEWLNGGDSWQRFRRVGQDCPRISREFLEEERRTKGPRWFAQEWECSFEEVEDAVFRAEDIEALTGDTGVPPLTFGIEERPGELVLRA